MKIAFLTPEYPHPKTGSSGGIGTSIKNLALGLIAQNAKVIVLVYGQKVDDIFIDQNIEIHQIKNIKSKGLSWWLTRKKIENKINQLHKENKIDIVEAPDWTGITSFINSKCPIVIKLHGSDTYFCHLDKRPIKALNKFHEKRALKKANGHIAVSQYVADVTNKVFNQKIPYKVIHNGVNLNNFKVTPSTNTLSILYLGTLIRKKGVLEIPYIFNELVKQIPNATLHLVGGDSADILTKKSSTWELMQPLFDTDVKDKVTYHGKVPYEKVNQFLEQATICIFPSFAEAFPVSWLEAMAKGKAIVASNIGWGPEVLTNNDQGILVSPIEHKQYASAIGNLLINNELRQDMQLKARKKMEEVFDINTIAKQNIEYYKSIIIK